MAELAAESTGEPPKKKQKISEASVSSAEVEPDVVSGKKYNVRMLNAHMRKIPVEELTAELLLPNGSTVGQYLLQCWKEKESKKKKNK